LNGDRRDEVVAGFRGPGGSVYLYTAADAAGSVGRAPPLDDAMSAAACTAVDLNGDGRIDIAASIPPGSSGTRPGARRPPGRRARRGRACPASRRQDESRPTGASFSLGLLE